MNEVFKMAEKRNWLFRHEISKLDNKELRKEYSRQRSIANKRIKRLKAAGLEYERKELFPTLSGLTASEVEKQLSDASKFLRRERTKVRVEKKYLQHEIAILNKKGYEWIDMSNIYDVIHFLEDMSKELGEKVYNSGDALDVFQEGERLNIPTDVLKENFNYFKENMSKLKEVKPITDIVPMSFDDIKIAVGELK